MAVQDFQKRINEICEYFPIMPRPRDTMPVTPRFATPDDNDKIAILHNACPELWRNEQARTNQMELDLEQLRSRVLKKETKMIRGITTIMTITEDKIETGIKRVSKLTEIRTLPVMILFVLFMVITPFHSVN